MVSQYEKTSPFLIERHNSPFRLDWTNHHGDIMLFIREYVTSNLLSFENLSVENKLRKQSWSKNCSCNPYRNKMSFSPTLVKYRFAFFKLWKDCYDDIHSLGRRKLIASDSSPEHSHRLPTFSAKLVVLYQKAFSQIS